MKLEKNIGATDLMIRLAVSCVLIYISIVDTQLIEDSLSSRIIAFLGFVNLLVSLSRFCPLYAITGINTCKSCTQD